MPPAAGTHWLHVADLCTAARSCATNAAYRRLVDRWVDAGFTLRYTGGMVPDVHHIIAKVCEAPLVLVVCWAGRLLRGWQRK